MIADKPSPLVPRLRFPEFDGASEWKPQRLDEVSPSIFDGTHQTPTYTEQGVPFYSVENLVSGTANKFISRDDYLEATRKNKPEKGDILLTRIGKIGHSQAVTWDHEFSIYVTLAVIKASPVFNTSYLAHYLQSGSYQTELIRKSLQSAVPPKINLDDLRSTLVLLPDMEEQVQIADCLGSLDDLIAAEGRKLEALRSHKQGLMQQLFPQPGETVPRLRFPEFLNGSAWDELRIRDICDLKAGDFIPASEIAKDADEGTFPCYGGNGFRGYVKSFTHEGRYVLVGRQGALCGNVNLYAGKFHATEHALVATPKPRIDTGWLFYAMRVLNLNRFSVGQAQPGLSVAVLRDVGISVPIGADEQQKIAGCLGSLDDLIAAEGRKLEALRQHKQGLMQQMFPDLER